MTKDAWIPRGECPACRQRAYIQGNGKMAWHEVDGEDCPGFTHGREARTGDKPPRPRVECPMCGNHPWARVDGTVGAHRAGHFRTGPKCTGEGMKPGDAPPGTDGEGYMI